MEGGRRRGGMLFSTVLCANDPLLSSPAPGALEVEVPSFLLLLALRFRPYVQTDDVLAYTLRVDKTKIGCLKGPFRSGEKFETKGLEAREGAKRTKKTQSGSKHIPTSDKQATSKSIIHQAIS
jgi:hypothetical protein